MKIKSHGVFKPKNRIVFYFIAFVNLIFFEFNRRIRGINAAVNGFKSVELINSLCSYLNIVSVYTSTCRILFIRRGDLKIYKETIDFHTDLPGKKYSNYKIFLWSSCYPTEILISDTNKETFIPKPYEIIEIDNNTFHRTQPKIFEERFIKMRMFVAIVVKPNEAII